MRLLGWHTMGTRVLQPVPGMNDSCGLFTALGHTDPIQSDHELGCWSILGLHTQGPHVGVVCVTPEETWLLQLQKSCLGNVCMYVNLWLQGANSIALDQLYHKEWAIHGWPVFLEVPECGPIQCLGGMQTASQAHLSGPAITPVWERFTTFASAIFWYKLCLTLSHLLHGSVCDLELSEVIRVPN